MERHPGSGRLIRRPLIIRGEDILVPLSNGAFAVVDLADHEKVAPYNWTAMRYRATTYAQAWICGRHVRLHRHLLDVSDPKVDVDHINRDGLDNRRANLRPATRSENMRNTCVTSRSRSGIKGVYWDARHRHWRASIKHQGKCHHLGCFSSIDEAASAYADASARLHGAFGRAA